MKYYGVKKGKIPGVYTSWDQAKEQVIGYSGAEHKKFNTRREAEEFVGIYSTDSDPVLLIEEDNLYYGTGVLVSYVDGSYDNSDKSYSFGAVFLEDTIKKFSKRYEEDNYSKFRNVIGELKGAMFAMDYAIKHGYKELRLHYDYIGIEMWAKGQWKRNNPATVGYKEYYDSIKDKLTVKFVKVDAHTGDKYNEMADTLAKEATFELREEK